MATDRIRAGDTLSEIRFGPISRTTLALYAGASDDHNPVHIDLDFARQAGLDDVFAHGMLSFGVLTRVVTQRFGAARLRSFGARFTAITHVHDVVSCHASVSECFEEDGERLARIAVFAQTAGGVTTLSGEAIVALD
ncbi:MaoC/PaaZ C-terminal domain-containing protein [Novosphingobium sp. Gsoil 351]|uniref:MaoC/PaaZ C-terminal domain-containing protein n=1 Tax=Novosphingobium sp. Gsoil 351 TaxID=2675225 RepID=UPI0012B4ED07|nr:MaoC/PaaZ C-terminal domain-containing protein [Novosphingobium sp. Gsoil 351]QGN55036.1 dehydratase [Novosphingobium sp. Gsoil 351]